MGDFQRGDEDVIRFHDFQVDVQTYAQRGKQNDFPLLKRCPHCQAKRPLYRHGYYERNAVTSHQSYRIWIARYRCPECRRTVAVLPSFLLPYFQYTLPTIWRVVKERLGLTPKRGMEEAPLLPTDEGVLFYVRRLFRNLNHLHWFFAERWRKIGPAIAQARERALWWIQTMEEIDLFFVIQEIWEHRSTHLFARTFSS